MLAASIQIAGMACILIASIFSLALGDCAVRRATIASMGALVASLLLQNRHAAFQPQVFVVDVVLLAVLAAMATATRRGWAIAAAAFQLLVIATHVAFLIQPLPRPVYLTALAMWAYFVVAAIAVGAALHLRTRFAAWSARHGKPRHRNADDL